ncbi:glycoside hydrolase family 2 protein [Pelagicoccus sp. NFK12]|uniref:Beta-mannosidase B n=1 Tax=Pelagicoccus enzymogenes TaxID=2773457 RepID=A0A927F4U5_9BACT|nr:glycoside hydrolase family 2 protein [Pelagicoccus enzymogenes]MBD5778177.1 glycoside hydrolase family 2 protein [Pelagicoccus enzymogenes]
MIETLSLDGTWTLKGPKKINIPATVPGCVHADLHREKLIPDPYFRDNEKLVQWVGEKSWTYSRSFEASESMLERDRVLLRFDGLDTLAKVTLNGKVLAETNNMFREWEFDVKDRLKVGENTISIVFSSALAYGLDKQKERFLWQTGIGHHRLEGGQWVRKEQSNFGWDWGPMIVTMGIWRSVRIDAFDTAEISELLVKQSLSKAFKKAELEVEATVNLARRTKLSAFVTVSKDGAVVASGEAAVVRGKAKTSLTVKSPQLWWPNGLGEQPLYVVAVSLLDSEGEVISQSSKRIGIRELKLVREKDKWGESFCFEANGNRFFAKGANWIPSDQFDVWGTDERNRDLLKSSVEANMNMIRVWGGGKYERDDFYDACDELGICIWQDFMFACAAYPGFDDDWVANVEVEIEQQVKRIRHHACLAIWCGNNELEHISPILGDEPGQMPWDEYMNLFDKVIGKIVKRNDPQRDYWPSSEHSPVGDRKFSQNPDCGDAHLWKVWHGREPFEWYRTAYHRFCSEFGFQSFPEPSTIETYTNKEERNVTSYVMEQHQRSPIGNSAIIDYMLSWFRLPVGFDNTIWLTQILQGLAIKYAVEHWRMNKPRCMGALYWQLNDCWQVASWSSVDFFGKWKALHYAARNFFNPLLVAGVEDLDTDSVAIHVVNDLLEAKSLSINWKVVDVEGRELETGSKKIRAGANSTGVFKTLKLKKLVAKHGQRGLIVKLALKDGRKVVSENLVTFARPKHLTLEDPMLSVKVKAATRGSFDVTVSAKKPALWTWLELKGIDARYSDNFVHLMAGESNTIRVTPQIKTTAIAVKAALRARSVFDTYQEI